MRVTAATIVQLDASADAVWARVGDFGGLAHWMPGVLEVEAQGVGPGSIRRCKTVAGDFVERLEAAVGRSYSYSIVSGPFPVTEYKATLSVRPIGRSGCEIAWDASGVPLEGVSPLDAERHLKRLQVIGLRAVQILFGPYGPS